MFLIIYVHECILHIVCHTHWILNSLESYTPLYLTEWLEHGKHNFDVKMPELRLMLNIVVCCISWLGLP